MIFEGKIVGRKLKGRPRIHNNNHKMPGPSGDETSGSEKKGMGSPAFKR